MPHDTNIFNVGSIISHDGAEWIVVRLLISHSVLLQKIDEPTTTIRVPVSKLLT